MVNDLEPLAGTRVVDLTRFVSGSYATMVLAALGAEVVKIEVPPHGDPYRQQGTGSVGGQSAIFLALNNGKRSVALDFRSPAARPAMLALLGSSDFLVENSRPGSLERYGLDYDTLHREYPTLVYGSISGYGAVGPDADRGGFDLILQAESGVMSVTGASSSGPVKVGAPVLDVGAGMSCVAGLLGAHIQRQTTGQGTHVSSSLFEFALGALTTLVADHLATGTVPELLGSHSPTFAPYGVFATADGSIAIAGTGSDRLWPALCSLLELDHLVDDARYRTNADRVRHRDELTDEIERALRDRPADQWLPRLRAAGIPAGQVRSLPDVLASEQVAALDTLQEQETAGERYRTVAPPLRLAAGAPHFPHGAPVLGMDTRAVLEEVGLSSDDVDDLCKAEIAVAAS